LNWCVVSCTHSFEINIPTQNRNLLSDCSGYLNQGAGVNFRWMATMAGGKHPMLLPNYTPGVFERPRLRPYLGCDRQNLASEDGLSTRIR